MFRLQRFARKRQRERRMIIDDHSPVAIQNLSPRSQQRNGLDTIAVRQFAVEIVIADLQHPEAADQEQEDRDAEVLKNSDAAQCETGIVAK